MKVVIVGGPQSGKTTLVHKIIRMNPQNHFQFILDGIEQIGVNTQLPDLPNMLVTTQILENIPIHIRNNALILNVEEIRR